MKTLVKHAHLSGRYDGSTISLEAQYANFLTGPNPVDILTGTEVEHPKRKAAIADFDGYGKFLTSKSYSDDCVIFWNTEDWKLIYSEAFQITKHRYYNERGLLRDAAYAKIVVLENKHNGKKMLVTVCHMPSHVQKGDGFYKNSQRVLAWTTGARNWRKRRNKLSRKYKCSYMLVSADWNVDIKVQFFRRLIKTMQPSMKYVWDIKKTFPHIGTHGTRLIDFSLIRGKNLTVVQRPKISPQTAASDHRPYREALGIR